MSQHRDKRGAGGAGRTKEKGKQRVGGVSAGRVGVEGDVKRRQRHAQYGRSELLGAVSDGVPLPVLIFRKSQLQGKVAISGVHTARTAQGAGEGE